MTRFKAKAYKSNLQMKIKNTHKQIYKAKFKAYKIIKRTAYKRTYRQNLKRTKLLSVSLIQ